MKIFLSFLFLLSVLFTAGPAPAKTFYLSDGSTIEYKRFWKQGDRIFVLINRDTLVDFAPEEVDQRRTLKAAKLKKFPKVTVKKKKTAQPAKEKSATVAAPARTAAVEETEKPVVFSDTISTPTDSTDASSRGESSAGDLSQELLAVYENLHNAMKSGNVAGVKQGLSARNAASMGPRELAMIESGVSLMPPNRVVTGSSVSPDGTSATLKMSARTNKTDRKPAATGTISFVRENGSWKLDKESWDMRTD